MPEYTVKYFALPALGEPIRLILHLGKIDFVDERLTFAEWPEHKPKTKWGQMPVVYAADGTEMTQTKALVRYFGKKVSWEGSPLYPTDAFLAFKVDEMIDAMEDVRAKLVATFKIEDQAEKEAARKALFADGGDCCELLKKIDSFSGSKFVVGDCLTIADIWFYFFLVFLRCGFFDGVPADYMQVYPNLQGVVANVAAIPEIKEYYAAKDLEAEPMYKAFVM